MPRPVFRGLRRRPVLIRPSARENVACSAETRFQGIATGSGCGSWIPPLLQDLLAVPRPVFRGLRPILWRSSIARSPAILQCRDPFSGDCDLRLFESALYELSRVVLQCRDPFSGDCDGAPSEPLRRRDNLPCSAETRFQGIATQSFDLPDSSLSRDLLQCRDPFSGDCDAAQRMISAGMFPSCSAETRFQGIATG